MVNLYCINLFVLICILVNLYLVILYYIQSIYKKRKEVILKILLKNFKFINYLIVFKQNKNLSFQIDIPNRYSK